MTLEWIDPPMNHDDKAHEAAEELRARPGEWARLARNTTDADSDRWGCALHALAGIDARFVRVDSRWWALLPELRRYDVYARAPKEA